MSQTVEDLEVMNERFLDEINRLVAHLSDQTGSLKYLNDIKSIIPDETTLSQDLKNVIKSVEKANESMFESLYGLYNLIKEKMEFAVKYNTEASADYGTQSSSISSIEFED